MLFASGYNTALKRIKETKEGKEKHQAIEIAERSKSLTNL